MDRRGLLYAMGAGLAGLAVSRLSEKSNAGEPSESSFDTVRSVRHFGVHATTPPQANKRALQQALDWACGCGGAVLVDPTREPYPHRPLFPCLAVTRRRPIGAVPCL